MSINKWMEKEDAKYIHTHIHTHTHTHIRTYTHIYTHTHIYTYATEYYSAIKKENNGICSNMDEPRDYHISVVIQKKKEKHHVKSFICDI